MSKKKIIMLNFVGIILLCISGIIIHIIKDKNVEYKSTLYNVERLEGPDSKEVSNFFLNCLNYTFNIADIQNKEILADSIRFQQENFKTLSYAQSFEGLYTQTSIKSLGIAKYNLLDVRKEEIETDSNDEEKLYRYIITYELSLSYEGKKEKMIGNAQEPCEAVISFERGSFKLERFFTKWVKL